MEFYSHVNYSVTKIIVTGETEEMAFYSHVNYSVTKMKVSPKNSWQSFTVT